MCNPGSPKYEARVPDSLTYNGRRNEYCSLSTDVRRFPCHVLVYNKSHVYFMEIKVSLCFLSSVYIVRHIDTMRRNDFSGLLVSITTFSSECS
jgi:hypothetical protein